MIVLEYVYQERSLQAKNMFHECPNKFESLFSIVIYFAATAISLICVAAPKGKVQG